MLYEDDQKEGHSEKDKKHHDIKCNCTTCVCEVLEDILEQQRKNEELCDSIKSLKPSRNHHETIPFMLQTPYGHPFFTFGKIGTDKCFVTVFFRVVKVDCKKNCALLELLKPDKSIIDCETDCVEIDKICEVEILFRTGECIFIDLSCYSAVNIISPELVKKKHKHK
ncbi:CotY/CotZ family spore coat protein [Filobacillus milosensis]|nr:CotY/CotZ family spore coat protein [Filobacillus milosensis]